MQDTIEKRQLQNSNIFTYLPLHLNILNVDEYFKEDSRCMINYKTKNKLTENTNMNMWKHIISQI